MARKLNVSIVIPIYNEAGVVEQSHAHLCAALDSLPYQFTFYYVDDGSRDDTEKSIASLAKKDRRVKLIALSRNFGHQAALSAGLDHADGDVIISMDGDGQHPPQMIPQMLNLIKQGYDIVQTQRLDEAQPASLKKWTSGLFYRLINVISGTRIIPGTADFRALSRRAVDAIKSMPEYHRFLRGMVAWIGFPMVTGRKNQRTVEIFHPQNVRSCNECNLLVFTCAFIYWPKCGRNFPFACIVGGDLCALLLGYRSYIQPCARLEFAHVRSFDRRRHDDDIARLYRRVCWFYIPGS
jgi:glycosyltransferase involved in cell wall biosynthesis